jgi:hypothetical protein
MDVFQSCVGKGTAENERSVAKSLLSYEASKQSVTVVSESFCYYCGILQLHVERHWFATHPYEPEVAEISRLKDGAERMRLVRELKNLGNHKHNGKVLSENESSFLMNACQANTTYLMLVTILQPVGNAFITCRKKNFRSINVNDKKVNETIEKETTHITNQ